MITGSEDGKSYTPFITTTFKDGVTVPGRYDSVQEFLDAIKTEFQCVPARPEYAKLP
ncbi:MAG: hypothetical protein MJ201_02480 [Mycoplasmoidaceae bacterium]|nr:hypothetical protein [Mycoplasmoidaceae bacterium]